LQATQLNSIVFQCGHSFHVACLEKAGCLMLVGGRETSQPADEQWQCYSCVTKNLGSIFMKLYFGQILSCNFGQVFTTKQQSNVYLIMWDKVLWHKK
jgi:hypothetical protein